MNDKKAGVQTNTMSTENFKYEPPKLSKATLVILVIVTALQAAAN